MSEDAFRPLRVFLVHAAEDKPIVRELYRQLTAEGGLDVWLDEVKLLPGQDWDLEIEKAVEAADAIIVCLSNYSVSKEGYVQKELRFVLNIADEKPEGRIFVVPLRLDNCNIPRRLRSWQFVDYFPESNRRRAYQRIVASLRLRANSMGMRTISAEKQTRQTVEEKYKRESEELSRRQESLQKSFREVEERLRREKEAQEKRKRYSGSIWDYIFAPAVGFITFISERFDAVKKKKAASVLQNQFTPYPNPYIAGNPIDPNLNRRMFFGRSDIVQMIYKEIKEPSQKPSLLLYGRRRMGKTSALLNLGRLMRDFSIVDIFISAQDIKYRTDSELAFNLIKQVIEKLKEATLAERLFASETYYMTKDAYKDNPVLVLSNFIYDCNRFLENNNLYCLFMFDEYELLGDSISKDFFMQIRDAMQHKPRFVFLFAGSHMPNEVKNSNWMEVFMNVKVLPISFLDRQDSYKLLTEPVPNLKYASQNLVNQILDVTGCQPLLLQSMATEIINRLNIIEQKTVDKSVVNYAIEKTLDAWGFNFFTYLWENDCNTRVDKELLKKIALNNSSIKKSTLENYASSLKKLKERDLLKVEKDEYVKLTMPIVKRWTERENPEIH